MWRLRVFTGKGRAAMHLALIGYGNIAQSLLSLMAEPGAPRPDRITVLARRGRSDAARAALAGPVPFDVVDEVAGLVNQRPDFAVECAGHDAVATGAVPLLRAGVDCIVVSVGALADQALETEVHAAAKAGAARVILPAGAVGGVDLLAALALGEDVSVTYRGIKPPRAWRGTAAEAATDLDVLDAPKAFFTGSAREAAKAYPKNANVAATLALAGGGFEGTKVSLIADPSAPGNVHSYEIRSEAARVEMRIENLPSPGNPKTSVSTIYSILREIRNRLGPIAI
ncbi:MAG: aspartate dehydrogenase [Pseudomonadota bacterium]